ncbi:MAG: hypothetical protein GY768_28810 [Planctomycetaceae bacterium]|nr:hypothetical protein [Planctomycetaceae bacterium]
MPRQKLLLILVSLMLAAYVADLAYRRLYSEPLRVLTNDAVAMKEQLQAAKLDVRREQNKLRELPTLEQQSLPSNLEVAVTDYRGWLLQLVKNVGIEGASVNSTTPTANREAVVRIAFLVRGDGTLEQIVKLLQSFYETEYLHRIQNLTLNPASDGRIRLTMTIESLAIPSATAAEFQLESSPQRDLGEFSLIARRNLFATGDPVANKIVVSAITSDSAGKRQAWVTDPTGKIQFLAVGQSMQHESFGLTVDRVEPLFVEVISDGQRSRIKIGQSLADAVKITE